ncbi:MAG TPA: acyl carrier protein [Pyrinomonadaceae bacterium]|jgi:acyl carrier protein|nr:acyl carrier protein [Pyrinomonadaceae bacterium]
MPEAIAERVIETIARSQKVSAEQITLDTTFAELGMTSLDALGLIFDLEEEFGVEIPNEEAMGLRDVRQSVESISKLMSERVAPEGGMK